eukprot:3152310-Amphidinium_carterae.1
MLAIATPSRCAKRNSAELHACMYMQSFIPVDMVGLFCLPCLQVMKIEWAEVMSGLRDGPESHEIHVRSFTRIHKDPTNHHQSQCIANSNWLELVHGKCRVTRGAVRLPAVDNVTSQGTMFARMLNQHDSSHHRLRQSKHGEDEESKVERNAAEEDAMSKC